MRPALLFWPLALTLLPALASADSGPASSLAWSPDGQWLSYSTRFDPALIRDRLRPGWIVDLSARNPDNTFVLPVPDLVVGVPVDRLWVTRVADGATFLVDEAQGWHLGPAWSPTSRALAFGRPTNDGKSIETVIWEARDRRRVVTSATVAEPVAAAGVRLVGEGIAWSGDGRYLALPRVDAPGLLVVRADDGRTVNTVPHGRLSAWSTDGAKLACIVVHDADQTLVVLDTASSVPRSLLHVDSVSRPPVWTRDGLVVANLGNVPFSPTGMSRLSHSRQELFRVSPDTGQTEPVFPMADEPTPNLNFDREVVFSFHIDPAGENLFWTWNCPTSSTAAPIVWARPREGIIRARYPLIPPLPVTAFAAPMTGEHLAIGVATLPPLRFRRDQADVEPMPILPDDDSRAAWVASLVGWIRTATQSPITFNDLRPPLPSLVTFPVGMERELLMSSRRQLARFGLAVLDAPREGGPPADHYAALFDEARVLFAAVIEDLPTAEAGLPAIEARLTTADQRVGLIGLRAQLAMAQGDLPRAGRIIAFLKETQKKPGQRLEWVAEVPHLTPASEPSPRWLPTVVAHAARLARPDATANTTAAAVRPADRGGDPFGRRTSPQPFRRLSNPFAGNGLVVPAQPAGRLFGPEGHLFIQPPPRVPAGGPEPQAPLLEQRGVGPEPPMPLRRFEDLPRPQPGQPGPRMTPGTVKAP